MNQISDIPDNTPVSVDEIITRIKKEAQKQPPMEESLPGNSGFSKSPAVLPKMSTLTMDPLPCKDVYILKDFSKYHGLDFLKTAYTAILGRIPDPEGEQSYLARLKNGEYTKTEILARLRYSREGRKKKVLVKGLLFSFALEMLFKIPFLGWGLKIITGVLTLPGVFKNIRKMENDLYEQKNLAQDQQDKMRIHVQDIYGSIAEIQEELNLALAKIAKLEKISENKADKDQLTQLSSQIAQLSSQTRDHKLNIVDMQRRIQFFLEQAGKRLPEPFSQDQISAMVQEEDHLLDAMYVSFEDRFRGTRQDIKERVKIYLPDVKKALAVTDNALVLDVGCGRGEWLEVLRENNINAMGLDLNRIMVAQCRDMGLEVLSLDLISHLRSLKSNTLCAVTGFHIVEHLPHKTLIALLDEALRVIKPGGIVIFETPNPENILVGAHYFYTDPSHINPLVPSTTQFLLEQRGYNKVEIRRLHKYSDYYPVTDQDGFKAQHMYNEMDFAVIGTKA